MDVYDFDGTIYKNDSSIDFYKFCLKKYHMLIACLQYQVCGFILHKLGLISIEKFKEMYFCFLEQLNIEDEVNLFWDSRSMNDFNKFNFSKDSLCISAGPEFLIKPICDKFGINSISTKFRGLKLVGKNCRGVEKVNRYEEEYKDTPVINFYFDDDYDLDFVRIAVNAFRLSENGNFEKFK